VEAMNNVESEEDVIIEYANVTIHDHEFVILEDCQMEIFVSMMMIAVG